MARSRGTIITASDVPAWLVNRVKVVGWLPPSLRADAGLRGDWTRILVEVDGVRWAIDARRGRGRHRGLALVRVLLDAMGVDVELEAVAEASDFGAACEALVEHVDAATTPGAA